MPFCVCADFLVRWHFFSQLCFSRVQVSVFTYVFPRKSGEPTWPGKLVEGLCVYIHVRIIYVYMFFVQQEWQLGFNLWVCGASGHNMPCQVSLAQVMPVLEGHPNRQVVGSVIGGAMTPWHFFGRFCTQSSSCATTMGLQPHRFDTYSGQTSY